jgi:hypothetical protein
MKLCSGCGTKLPDNHRGRCDACKSGAVTADDGIKSHSPMGSTPSRDKYADMYKSKQWTQVSKLQRSAFPFCEDCHGMADLADHYIPAVVFIEMCRVNRKFLIPEQAFFYFGNLRSLCNSCHRKKTLADNKKIAENFEWPDLWKNPIRPPKKWF